MDFYLFLIAFYLIILLNSIFAWIFAFFIMLYLKGFELGNNSEDVVKLGLGLSGIFLPPPYLKIN